MAVPLNELYYGCNHDHLHLAAGGKDYELPSFLNISKLAGQALKRIFKSKKADVDIDLFNIAFGALEEAVSIGAGKIEYGQPNYELAQQLRQSSAVFASAKSLNQAKELAALTVRPDGKVRTWEEFETLAKPITEDYNQRWLKTEFNTGIRAANAAIEWKGFEAAADLYPNLEYLPSVAATPSEEHKAYYHIRLPLSDPFWIKHLPPSRYNCQCGVEQTDEDATDHVAESVTASPGLDNNPGLTGKLFSDSHPYIASLTEEELKYVTKKAKQYVTRRNEDSSRPG